jgi:hypothetical protein
MNMSELEKMGRNLMDIALQYTHPNFERMYSDWDAVCNIGEELVKMSEQPQLNENQKALVIWMQENECYNGDPLESISDLFLEGTPSEHFPDLPLSCVEAAYQSLNNQQKIEMVQKYLEQYLEQGEE